MRAWLPFLVSAVALAQPAALKPVSIDAAVAMASERYPLVRVSQEQLAAASAAIQLARTVYLPRVDSLAQVNRATRDNVFGLLLPQPVIPSLSGPVLGTNDLTNVWGSAVGVLASWEPFDFGLREANVAVTEAARRRSAAAVERTRFEVAVLTADAYLTLMAAENTARAAEAAVTRAAQVEQVTGAVVEAGLRPGADLSRAQAERAMARTQLIQARQAVEVARATLAQFTGTPVATVPLAPRAAKQAGGEHPRLTEQSAAIEEVKARERALDRAYYPKVNLQGSLYARGSGARTDGSTGGVLSGLGPNYQNWALGLSLTFPLMDFASLRVKKQIEVHNERAEQARRDQIATELSAQMARATAALEAARAIVENTPVLLRAAREGQQQATARYKSGLSSVIEVAEAERLLTQAEIDDALARLAVRRAELAVASAMGSLDSFLESTRP